MCTPEPWKLNSLLSACEGRKCHLSELLFVACKDKEKSILSKDGHIEELKALRKGYNKLPLHTKDKYVPLCIDRGCKQVCKCDGISVCYCPKKTHTWTLHGFGDTLYVVIVASSDLFIPHYPTANVWFIYIHGYPDNEAFNPGDPAVRTMNPITSCRLWDGMADSETDGRGCTWPAIQSHSSRLLPVSPVHVLHSNLSTGKGQKTWYWYIVQSISANTHKHTCAQLISRSPLKLLQYSLFSVPNCRHVSLFLHIQNASMSSPTSPAGGGEVGKEGRKRLYIYLNLDLLISDSGSEQKPFWWIMQDPQVSVFWPNNSCRLWLRLSNDMTREVTVCIISLYGHGLHEGRKLWISESYTGIRFWRSLTQTSKTELMMMVVE